MKNCILTPTYSGHFSFIEHYLKSFELNAEYDNDCMIAFVLSDPSEADAFKSHFGKYIEKMPIAVFDIESIMSRYDVANKSEELLKRYGHTSYQMFKKIYSMLYIDAERFFVLDSEAAWISAINISNMFDDFFSDPFIVVSDFSSREKTSDFLKDHFDATNCILGYEMEKMPFEHFMWFYTKKTIENFVDQYGQPIEMAEKVFKWEMETKGHSVGLMETMLLLNYLYEGHGNIKYRTVSAEEELAKYLGNDNAIEYRHRFFTYGNGGWLGMLEFPCELLTKDNVDQLARLYRENNIFITRCDHTTKNEYDIQKKFLGQSQIKILAVSQDHAFLPDMDDKAKRELISKFSSAQIKQRFKNTIKRFIGRA